MCNTLLESASFPPNIRLFKPLMECLLVSAHILATYKMLGLSLIVEVGKSLRSRQDKIPCEVCKVYAQNLHKLCSREGGLKLVRFTTNWKPS